MNLPGSLPIHQTPPEAESNEDLKNPCAGPAVVSVMIQTRGNSVWRCYESEIGRNYQCQVAGP